MAALLIAAGFAPPAAGAQQRFSAYVADALRTPTHRFALGERGGHAAAQLVFIDRERSRTRYRTCVRRNGRPPLRICFRGRSGRVGTATVTPLRFRRGRYGIVWKVGERTVARWAFRVVPPAR